VLSSKRACAPRIKLSDIHGSDSVSMPAREDLLTAIGGGTRADSVIGLPANASK